MTVLKRTVMTLYSDAMSAYSHQVRLVLAEKGVNVDVLSIDANHPCEDLIELNSYNTLPTLVDRELVLYTPNVIMEYLDERFPHPPLLPVYPVARARCRLTMYRIDRDWYSLAEKIQGSDERVAESARLELRDSLVALSGIFAETHYFLSEDFTLVDCCLAPLLWRLPTFGVQLPAAAKPIKQYARRIFEKGSFQASLSDAEHELWEGDVF